MATLKYRSGGVAYTVGAPPSDGGYMGTWSVVVDYKTGDTVMHNDSLWGAVSDPAVAAEPGVDAAWEEITASGGGGSVVYSATEPPSPTDGMVWIIKE